MIIVERHHIKSDKEFVRLCTMSKLLYNKCNYYMRQAWFTNSLLPDINKLVQLVQNEDSYKNLHNTKTAKQTIRKCLNDWSTFFKALKAYKRDS